jgi:uncharacterized protein (TIGR00369 family)
MTETVRPELTPEYWNERSKGSLPGLLGVVFTEVSKGHSRGHLEIQPHHFAPNGFLHAATVVCLADTLCGCGCLASLPEGATGFTTIELKSNHLGTAKQGVIVGDARLVHGGRTTQVWDAQVTDEATGKPIALFRCTQMLLYPRS